MSTNLKKKLKNRTELTSVRMHGTVLMYTIDLGSRHGLGSRDQVDSSY
jgi:hypothetical protein